MPNQKTIQDHPIRSRLVIDMQAKTTTEMLKIAHRNFRLAYTNSHNAEDIILFTALGPAATYAEFTMQSLFMTMLSVTKGLVIEEILTKEQALESWDGGFETFRDLLMKGLNREAGDSPDLQKKT